MAFASIDELEPALRGADYLPDRGLATALFLSLRLEKPLLLEGEAGVGKTEAAKALARALPARLIRLQCYEGLDVAHAVYEWNYSRQLLHIRAAQEGTVHEEELFGPEFLIRRPLLEAIESEEPVVLLIDEIDRADEEFEAFLLEVLSDFQITIPEVGTISAARRPSVILTSNRTRELHDALKRRCLFHWIGHPALEREIEIVVLRVPGIPERLATQAARFVRGLRGSSADCAGSTWRSLRASPRRSTGRTLWPHSAARSSMPRSSSRPSARCSSTTRTSRPSATPRWPRWSRRHALSGEPIVRQVVTFGRVLREAGLEVGPGRICGAMTGLDLVGLERRDDVYWTLRQTLVSRADDIDAFDRAFAAWFLRAPELAPPRTPQVERVKGTKIAARDGAEENPDQGGGEGEERAAGWSAQEILRAKDFSELTSDELKQMRRLIDDLAAARPQRRSRRLRRHPHGATLDLRRLVRQSLATGGDPVERAFRNRVETNRKLIVLCDVSGSMEPYSRAILLFVHALLESGRGVEAFAFGTRLTRLTEELAGVDPERALEEASKRVVDWSGGTRIGASLKAFNDQWGRRALSRGAVVVIVSDGWEREDTATVAREMARLARCAYSVVWVNPLKGHPDYEPLAGGMRAALPYVDRFLPGHNLASLEDLAGVLSGIERRHAA